MANVYSGASKSAFAAAILLSVGSCALVQRSVSAQELWDQLITVSPNVPQIPQKAVINSKGYIIALCHPSPSYNNFDDEISLVAYDPAGNQLWSSSAELSVDVALALGGHDHTFTLSSDPANSNEPAVLENSADGTPLNSWLVPEPSGDFISGILASQNDDVYVYGTSSFTDPTTGAGYAGFSLVKTGVDGKLLWARTYNPVGGANFLFDSPVLDRQGDIIVAGTEGGPTLTILKYLPDGRLQSCSHYPLPVKHYSAPSIAINAGDDIYVGMNAYTLQSGELQLIKISASGAMLWNSLDSDNGHSLDQREPLRIALDNSGAVVAAGTSADRGLGHYSVLAKYSGDGSPLWTHTITEANVRSYRNTALFVKPDGKIATVYDAVKYTPGVGSSPVVATTEFDTGGNSIFAQEYAGIPSSDSSVSGVTAVFDPFDDHLYTINYDNSPDPSLVGEVDGTIVAYHL